jgi:hypothetical protein
MNHNGRDRLALTLFYLGIAIGAFGFIMFPVLLIRHMLLWPGCNGSNLLYRIPAFSALLTQDTLTESGVCIFELFCAFLFLFRVGYVLAFRKAIMDWQLARVEKLQLQAKPTLAKMLVTILIVFFGVFIVSLSPASEVNSFGAGRASVLLISFVVFLAYLTPELVLWAMFLVFA